MNATWEENIHQSTRILIRKFYGAARKLERLVLSEVH